MPLLLSYKCGGGGGVLHYLDRREQEEKREKVWFREFLLHLGRIEMRYFNKKGGKWELHFAEFLKEKILQTTQLLGSSTEIPDRQLLLLCQNIKDWTSLNQC